MQTDSRTLPPSFETSATPTHADIARAARVHRTTVSLALRDDSRLPRETRERIQQIAFGLGYRASPLVNALMAQVRSRKRDRYLGTIAFVSLCKASTNRSNHDSDGRMIEGAKARAQELGWRLDRISHEDTQTSSKRMHEILGARGIGGVLVMLDSSMEDSWLKDLSGFAIATVGSYVDHRLRSVSTDSFGSIQLACRTLRAHGYGRIALWLSADEDNRAEQHWRAGFHLWQHEVPADEHGSVFVLPLNSAHGSDWADEIRTNCPDAIVCSSRSVRELLEKAGRPVPREIGLALLDRRADDHDFAGIDQRHEAVGARAVDVIVDALYRNERINPAASERLLISSQWVSGPSIRQIGKVV